MASGLKLEMVSDRPNRAMDVEQCTAPMGDVGKPVHPVQKIQLCSMKDRLKLEEKLDAMAFGTHMANRNKIERTLLAQEQRLPGLESSLVGLESHLDLDETQTFEDFLNRKENSPIPELGFNHTLHDVMERKLGM